MTKIYYDITDLLEYARHNTTLSGIQRVSLELLSLIVAKHGCDRLKIIAMHPLAKRVFCYDPSCFAHPYKFDQGEFCQLFGLAAPPDGLDTYLNRKYGRSPKRNFHRLRLLALDKLSGGATLRVRGITAHEPRLGVGKLSASHPQFEPGDVVFVPGATWDFDRYMAFLAHERQNSGIRVFHFVHDLIPLITPEHVGQDVPARFIRWLDHLGRNTDRFITNSRASQRDLDTWMAGNGFDVPSRVVKLAHQFCSEGRPKGRQLDSRGVRGHVLNTARVPFVLCVGTIESRKNIWALATAWKAIYEKLGCSTPRLLFAGKNGGHKGDFDDFMKGTGSLYGYIRVVERPTDEELAFLYQKSIFTVFPSYIEGWGLPVGESLWFGRPVVCSNSSSMPEVGGTLADYVDPYDQASIEAALLKMITDGEYRRKRSAEIVSARLRTWADMADDLWNELSREDHRLRMAQLRSLTG